MQIFVYLDNIRIVGFSPQDVEWAVWTVLQTLMQTGYINLKKSDRTLVQDLVYIGGRFQMDFTWIFLQEIRKDDALICILSFRKVGSDKPAHQFLHLLGLVAATLLVMPYANLRMRLIQWYLKNQWLNHIGLAQCLPIPTRIGTFSGGRWGPICWRGGPLCLLHTLSL